MTPHLWQATGPILLLRTLVILRHMLSPRWGEIWTVIDITAWMLKPDLI